MTLTNFVFGIGLVAAAWFATATILIYEALRKRNIKVSFIFLRFLSINYASQYKKITLQATGKAGPLFYHWIISINIVLASAILILLLEVV